VIRFAGTVLALLWLCAPAAAQATRGAVPTGGGAGGEVASFSQSHALVIGIDGYSNGWKRLSKAKEDAREIAAALTDAGFQDVQVLYDLNHETLPDAIEDFIYTKGANPDARLLIWFAGHGHMIGTRGYLVPTDAPVPGDDLASQAAFQRVAMPLLDFQRYMNDMHARHVLAVFDACFSASVFGGGAASVSAAVAETSGQKARQFIASGSFGEVVADDGSFRKAFIAALNGEERAALSHEGYLTGSRLGAFLAEKISRQTNGKQNPIYSVSNQIDLDRGDFLFPAHFPASGAVVDVPEPADAVEAPAGAAEPVVPEIRMDRVEWNSTDPEIGVLADKIARNLVEYYDNNRLYISSELTGRAPARPVTHYIYGRVTGIGDEVQFDIELKRPDGERVGSASFGGPKAFYVQHYKVLPQTIQYLFDTSLRTMEPLLSSNQPTQDGYAYALFLAARQRASRNQFKEARDLVWQAIDTDSSFAQAYAAYGQLSLKLGEPQSVHDDYLKQAQLMDPDYAQLSVFANNQLGDPIPALREAALVTPWTELAPGLELRRIETLDYGTSVLAWRYDAGRLALKLVKSKTARGETAAEFRERTGAVLAINAGFFDLDMASRLTPVGLLVVEGREVSAFNPEKAKNPLSGLLYSRDGELGLMWSRDYATSDGFQSALQTGPFVVDPGGKNGIYRNNYDRQNRSVVCFDQGGQAVIVQVSGGLSLFEVGDFLSTPESEGGLGCERALNLDGGPSSQVSVLAEGASLEVPGLWRISSSLVLVPRE
jgi:uncharacterized protein YigE (DUF2233 family)